MSEIQNRIYLYQFLKYIFLCISVFCFFVLIWLYHHWRKYFIAFIFLVVISLFFVNPIKTFAAEETIPVTLKMKEGKQLQYTKIYDRDDFRVFQNIQTEDILENLEDIEIEGKKETEDVFVKDLKGVLEEPIKEVTQGSKVEIFLTDVELGGKDASKYKVDLEERQIRLEGKLTIKKRKINLKVADGKRAYGHYNEIYYDTDMPVQENRESYTNLEIEGLLKGDMVSYPTPCEKEVERNQMPDYSIGEWKDRITVKHDGETGKNYEFNYQEIARGNLTIEPESIEDFSQYIEFETDKKQIFFDQDTGKLWVDGKMKDFHIRLKENEKTKFYTGVCMETGEIISKNENELDFTKKEFPEGEEQKIKLFLVNEENKVKSEVFEISVFLDSSVPKAKIDFGDTQQISQTGVYGEDVDLELCVKDEESAIVNVEVLVTSGGKETARKVLLENKSFGEIVLPYKVTAQENRNEDVCVTIIVEDCVGNKAEKELHLQMDTILPKVSVQCFCQSVPFYRVYSKNPVVLQILYQEKNFSKEKEYLWFEAEIDGETDIYSLPELEKKLHGEMKWTDEGDKHKLEIFLEEGSYKITPFVQDFVQRTTQNKVVQGEEFSICIDTQEPEVSVEVSAERDKFKVHIQGTDFGKQGGSSGLKEIYYVISDGKKEKKKFLLQASEEEIQDFSREVVVPIEQYGDMEIRIQVFIEDKAGNKGKSKVVKSGIDVTAPKISVQWSEGKSEQGNYYHTKRTAFIEITEKNFDPSFVKWEIKGKAKIGEWRSKGERHQCEVVFSEDGVYRLAFSCADRAGNQEKYEEKETFVIDQTKPVIKISNITDQSANKGKVSPVIEIRDLNYQMGGFTVDIMGSDKKSLKLKKRVKKIEGGQEIFIVDLPRTKETDDMYTLSVTAVDKAGNRAETEIVFSVNRYGSVYEIDLNTQKWLNSNNRNYTYLKKGEEIGIYEYNIDTIKESILTINCDGELKNLKEGQDYTVEILETEGKWKKKYYRIKAENFEKEGNYTIILNSKDCADNSMNNLNMKRKTQAVPLSFTIDKTPPTILVSGIEKNGKYQGMGKEVIIEVMDNLALEKVEVQIGNRKIQYGREELKQKNGIIRERIYQDKDWQEIQIWAVDAAGNEQKEIFRVLVSQDFLVKIMWTFFLGIGLFLLKQNNKSNHKF